MKLHKLTVLIVSLLALFAILIPSADAHDGPFATNATSGNDSGSATQHSFCLLYTSPSPRDATLSRMPSSA